MDGVVEESRGSEWYTWRTWYSYFFFFVLSTPLRNHQFPLPNQGEITVDGRNTAWQYMQTYLTMFEVFDLSWCSISSINKKVQFWGSGATDT